MLRKWWLVPLAFVLGAIGAGLYYRHQSSGWELKARAAVKASAAQRARADSLAHEAARIDTVAGAKQVVYETKWKKIEEQPVPVPCQPIVAPRDSLIDSLIVNNHRLQTAYDKLHAAYQVALARGDSLEAVLKGRPKGNPWWVPQLGLGGFAGMSSTGKPTAGLGLTLSWRIHL